MITRIYCSRSAGAHKIGDVSADAEGLLLSFRDAVITTHDDPNAVRSPQDGHYYRPEGAEAQLRHADGERLGVDMWCSACKTGHPVDASALFNTARARRRKVTLTSRGAWEGIWTP